MNSSGFVQMIKKVAVILVVVFLFISPFGCSDRTTETQLSGGILATFDVEGEEYKIFVKNPDTIAQILALEKGESQAKIPSGRVIGKKVSYNAPWSWHIDPYDIEMAELTIEVCSGRPSDVEKDLDYWVNNVGRFCPWSAVLIDTQDFRLGTGGD